MVTGLSLNDFSRTIWLPSNSKMLQSSPELVATGAIQFAETNELALRPWLVKGLALSVTDVQDLLLTAGDSTTAFSSTDMQFWHEKGHSLGYLHRRFDQLQERLLAGLGFAARLLPTIEKGCMALHRNAPTLIRPPFCFSRRKRLASAVAALVAKRRG